MAFEALYYRHDASKSFNRPTLTNLPVNKGKDILSAFSLITYLKTQTSFNDHELREFLLQATKLVDCECDMKDLITDLLRAFCMLLQDGTVYEYTHRSFQEYFAACYLVSASENKKTQLIKQFAKKADKDITLKLAYGMNPKMIEEKLIIPFLSEMKKNIGFDKVLTPEVFKNFATTYFDDIHFYKENYPSISVARNDNTTVTVLEKTKNLEIIRFLLKLYDIDTRYPESGEKYFKKEMLPVSIAKGDQTLQIADAFEKSDLVDWFVNYSIESRVLNKFMKLERELQNKNEENNELFQSLLE